MTLAEILVMISIGNIIVEPIVERSVVKTIILSSVIVAATLILEFLQLKFNTIEKLFSGKSKILIENGTLNVKNLKKVRLTVDQLEMRMRNYGISQIEDVKFATIEPNGLLGYELKEDAKPVTVGELKKLLNLYLNQNIPLAQLSAEEMDNDNIFKEINHQSKQSHSDYLK